MRGEASGRVGVPRHPTQARAARCGCHTGTFQHEPSLTVAQGVSLSRLLSQSSLRQKLYSPASRASSKQVILCLHRRLLQPSLIYRCDAIEAFAGLSVRTHVHAVHTRESKWYGTATGHVLRSSALRAISTCGDD